MRNVRVARNHLWNFSSLLFSNQAYIMGVRKRSTCGIDKWYNNKLLTRNIILMQKRKISTRSLRSLAGATNQRNYFKRNSWNYDNEFFRASDLRNNLNLLPPPPVKHMYTNCTDKICDWPTRYLDLEELNMLKKEKIENVDSIAPLARKNKFLKV